MIAWIKSLGVVIQTLKIFNDLYAKFKAWNEERLKKASDATQQANTDRATKIEDQVNKPLPEQDNDVLREEMRKKHGGN